MLVFGAANGLPIGSPLVSPSQLSGLEINAYARELAQVVVWIGYIEWKLDNGFRGNDDPVLEPLETIRYRTLCSTSAIGASEGSGMAGGRLHHRESPVFGSKSDD